MRLSACLLGLALLAASAGARAACPSQIGASPGLMRQSVDERARFLRRTLDDQRARTLWWNWGFATLGYAVGAGQLALGLTTDQDGDPGERNRKAFFLVNATRGTLATTWHVLQPLRMSAGSLRPLPTADDPPSCDWLAAAEADLALTARYQTEHHSPLKHVIVGVTALASGLTLGLGFDEWQLGALSAGMAVVMGETQFWLQPMGATRALEQYRAGTLSARRPEWPLLALSPGSAARGFALAVRF
jgi:hypothetical protein